MPESKFNFPDDFIWGTATAAYQIEGAVSEDGRGPSIWDTFSHTSGRIANGDTGDIAADHYHRWQEDVRLMQELNLNGYRFSIAWPRILPQGRGRVNQPGLDFYSRLVDTLLDAGIEPFVTLYHWDLPQRLEDEEGWRRRGIIDDFVNYADIVTRALGDRVKHWITFNEPWVFTWLGYTLGLHAPGHMSGNPTWALLASHHVHVAHGKAVPVIRANSPGAQVGITQNLVRVEPASDNPEDIAAARRFDGYHNRWYLDPLFKGTYPEDIQTQYAVFMPEFEDGDMEIISTPIDFLGVNYYTRAVIADEPEQFGLQVKQVAQEGEHTNMDWEVYPHGLYAALKRVHEEYGVESIYITESGASFDDVVTPEGEVHDQRRVAYLQSHFEAAARALEEGIPLKGYFVWSLMDNFEWAEGFSKRFGVVYVDYETQDRIIKDSGRFLARIAAGVPAPVK